MLTDVWWSYVEITDGCWYWRGPLDHHGYGRQSKVQAHRASYSEFRGPIPAGYHVDHQCHNSDDSCRGVQCLHRSCVRPDHLEAVPAVVNLRRQWPARKTHCHKGHEFTIENTYTGRGHRQCRACQRAAVARYQARKRSASRSESGA